MNAIRWTSHRRHIQTSKFTANSWIFTMLIRVFLIVHRIICPEEDLGGYVPSLWSIMSKVRFEAFLWGAGTALGELPPYFMAKVILTWQEHESFQKQQISNWKMFINFAGIAIIWLWSGRCRRSQGIRRIEQETRARRWAQFARSR